MAETLADPGCDAVPLVRVTTPLALFLPNVSCRVFINDEEFTEDFKRGVRSMTRSECIFGAPQMWLVEFRRC